MFLLPSEKESFGLVALEAMAASMPVISTNIGGLARVNIDGKTGFTSAVGDLEKMANDAISLLSNDELYHSFSSNANQVAKEYDLPKVLPLYEEAYQEALGKLHKGSSNV